MAAPCCPCRSLRVLPLLGRSLVCCSHLAAPRLNAETPPCHTPVRFRAKQAEAMTEVTSVQAAPTTALAASQPARAGGFMLRSLLRAAVVVAVAAVALGAAALPTAKGSARSGAKAPGSHKKW